MAKVLAKIKVEDYDKWKSLFDKFSDDRKSKGSRGATIFRDAEDPNLVIVLFDWDNPDNARKHAKLSFAAPKIKNFRLFHESQVNEKIPQKGGVLEEEEIHILNEVDKTSA